MYTIWVYVSPGITIGCDLSKGQWWYIVLQKIYYRVDSRFAPSQWEMALLCSVSHWLRANLESALHYIPFTFLYPPLQRSWKGWILVSPCPSVHCPSIHLSVCGWNHVRSVSLTILVIFISCLHILSSNFRSCVTYKVFFKIQTFEGLANSLNL